MGGVISQLRQDDGHLRIQELKKRILAPETFLNSKEKFQEIIIATNPTPEGNATAALVQRMLNEINSPAQFKITHLAKGLPVGGELEYADEETLESAFEGRK